MMICLTPWVGPTLGLFSGIVLALLTGNHLSKRWRDTGRLILQIAVVGLGFSLNLHDLIEVGLSGLLIAAVTISFVFTLGWLFSRWLGVEPVTAVLIAGGTAICGGSAIAAIGSSIKAREHAIAVAMSTVFTLNAIALALFPILGHAMGLTDIQFGQWAGIAIHDISSVVGAATAYHGDVTLVTATTVKLSRTLWIIPVSAIAAWVHQRHHAQEVQSAKRLAIHVPWFLLAFLIASMLRTFVGALAPFEHPSLLGAKALLTASLFLIGAGIDRKTLRCAGVKSIMLGVLLWVAVASVSLGYLLFLE
jgi:uncharacterized integral membrane protein (TIGR00698 family)